MAENLNLQGTVDIDVSGAVRNLEQLADAGGKVADSLAGDGSLLGLEKVISSAVGEARSLKDRLTEVAMLDMADLGVALSLEREVGLAGQYGTAIRLATAHLEEHQKALLEIEGAERQLAELAEKRAAAERSVRDSQKGVHNKAYQELEDSLNKQVELQYRLNRVRDLGGENAAKFSKEMVAQQEAEAKAIEEALEAEKKLNYETAQRLGIDLTPLTQAKQDELEATHRLIELEERYIKLRAETRKEDVGRVHDIERAHAAALKLNQELAKVDQDKAFATYAPNVQATQDRIRAAKEEEQQYNKLANTRYALQDLAFTWTAISTATLGAATAAIKVGADYEKSFRSVQRTTLTMGDAANALRSDLLDLTTAMPQDFESITSIATLGAQMNVATQDLEKFTETVSMFSSTTDVSVEKASMSLGRFAQLTETPITSIDRLASSIYHVGINAVATEGQILAIAEQIAVSGNLAGFANHEIIGLAAALASLGVQPEAARGAVMRIFNIIRQGVEEGGDALEQFAAVSGTSAQDFAQTWLSQPQEAFNMFVEGLERVADTGGSVSLVLKEMGLSNVRDLRVLELLADNTEVYADALADAAESYGANTALAEGYAIEVDNLNDQMIMLINSLKAFLAEMGIDEGLKRVVKWVLEITERFRTLMDVPVLKWFARLSVTLIGLVGMFAAYQAISARATASTMGLVQALRGMGDSVGLIQPGMRGLLNALVTLNAEQRKVYNATKQTTGALHEQTAAARTTAASMSTVAKTSKSVATGANTATTAVKTFGRATVVLAAVAVALELVSRGVEAFAKASESATSKVNDYLGTSTGLRDAMIADGKSAEEGATVLATWTRRVEDSGNAAADSATGLAIAADGQIGLREEIETTTGAIEEQILAFGAQSKQALVDAINQNLAEADFSQLEAELFSAFDFEGFGKQLFDDIANGTDLAGESVKAFEADLGTLSHVFDQVQASFTNSQTYADPAVWEGIRSAVSEIPPVLRDQLSPELREVLNTIETLDNQALADGALQQRFADLFNNMGELSVAADSTGNKIVEVFRIGGQDINEYARTTALATEAVQQLSAGMGLLEEDAEGAEEGLVGVANAASEMAEAIFGGINSAASMEGALENLGAALWENGADFSIHSAEGRENLAALESAVNAMAVHAGDDVGAFTGYLMSMLGGLEAQGINTAEVLSFVYDHLITLVAPKYGIDISTAAARQNLINLLQDGQAVKALLAELGALEQNIRDATAAGASYKEISSMLDQRNAMKAQVDAVNEITSAIANATDATSQYGGVADAVGRGVSNAFNKARDAAKGAGGAGKKAGKDTAKSAKEAQKEVRTLADYVSDLSSVMSRSFEFRFGVQSSRDATADLWANIRKSAEDARDAVTKALQDIMDADAKLKGLKADRQILEYQLTVAEEYGDTLRAAQIRAELADTNANIAKTEKEKADAQKAAKAAQDAANKSLVGNSAAARKNRADILGLVQSYQKQVEALADSGLSTKQLQRETEKLRQDFVRQASQAGYSKSEIDKYTKSFRDMSTVISKVPRKITVNANVSPAQRAINEFIAKKQKAAKVPSQTTNPTKKNLNNVKKAIERGIRPNTIRPKVGNPTGSDINKVRNWIINQLNKGLKIKPTLTGGGGGKFTPYWTGGFTGRGSKYEEAGIVHKGEYVVPSQFVNQSTGLPDMNALGQSLGMNTYSSSVSSVTNTTTVAVVELSARDRQLLQQMGNPQIVMDGRVVATATNRNNLNTSRRGVG